MAAAIPPELALVRSFANTLDVEHGTDAIATPAGLESWCVEAGLAGEETATSAAVRRAAALRATLRDHLLANNGWILPAGAGAALAAHVRGARLRVALEDGAVRIAGGAAGADGALGEVVAAAAVAMLHGSWRRLKICPADDCRWAFVDTSPALSRQWCSMRVCGNREKVRAFRARQAGTRGG